MSRGSRKPSIVLHSVVLRELTVADVTDLGPHARRVVLVGEQLFAFERDGQPFPAFVSPGPEDHLKLVLPATAGAPVVLPELLDGKLVWPTDPEPTRRDVSVRHFDADAGELTLEVVRHGGPGPLAGWAERVAPGDRIHLTGPRSSRLAPAASHVVLVGDLTSLAAVARWTFETPEDRAVTALVAVPGGGDERPVVRSTEGLLDLRWFHAPPEEVLVDALATVELGDDPFVFVGAENAIAKAAREFLRERRGLSLSQFRCIGYWRAP